MNVSVARYLLGVATALGIFGSLGAAATVLRARFFAGWRGAIARLTESLIGLTLLIAILEVLGAAGLFALGPVLASCLLTGAVVWWRVPGERPRARPVTGGATAVVAAAFWVVGALATATVFAEWASPTLQAYDVGVHVVDSLWYHLPWAASFAQTGHVTPPRFTDVEFLTAFYPATGEMLHGLGIVVFGRDTLTPGLNLVWLGLTALAAYSVGRDRVRGSAAVVAVAVVMATPMMYFSQPGSADNDIIGVFFFLSAAALLLREEHERAAYVLAAIAAGFAASIKLTFLVPVAVLTIAVLAGAPAGRRVGAALAWLGPGLLAGGFWYARNLIAVGNPLPWMSFGILPTPAPPVEHNTNYAVAHYLTDGRVWSHFTEPALASGLGGWWYVIVSVAIVGPVLCLLPGASARLRMLALVALGSLVAYLFTPNSAMGPPGDPVGIAFNVRYGAPALGLAFALLPLAPVLAGVRRQAAVVVGLLVVLTATVAAPVLWPGQHAAGAAALGVVVLAAGGIAIAARARPRLPRPLVPVPARAVVIAGALALVCAGAAAGYAWQRHYMRGRYVYRPHVSNLARVWALFRSVHDARVGIVGTYGGYFAYPLFGLDDSNRVLYIAHHGPHGSFTQITTCREWRAAVTRARLEYLVTTPKREFWRPRELFYSPEEGWTASDPAARVIYRADAVGQPVVVFKLRGALDPARCP